MSDFLQFTYSPGEKIQTDNAIYIKDLVELRIQTSGAFTQDELDKACQSIMSHYARPGLITMQKLLAGEKVIVRDFIRELGKMLPDA